MRHIAFILASVLALASTFSYGWVVMPTNTDDQLVLDNYSADCLQLRQENPTSPKLLTLCVPKDQVNPDQATVPEPPNNEPNQNGYGGSIQGAND